MAAIRIMCVWLAFGAVALATDITTCYQTIVAGDVGVLQVDLDCSQVAGYGPNIGLHPAARLQLNGHRLLGGRIGVGTYAGRGRRATIDGPGEISGMTGGEQGGSVYGCGIAAENSVLVRNVQVHDNRCGIVSVYTHRVDLEDVSVTNNVDDGITYYSDTRHKRVSVERVTVTGNGGAGIRAPRTLSLKEATVTGNGGGGAIAGLRVGANYSALTGNGVSGDVATRRASLRNTTCEHSVDLKTGGTLGLCSLD